MENTQINGTQPRKWKIKVNKRYLFYGVIFTALTVIMMIFLSQFFWIGLAPAFTFLALSIDAL